MRTLLLTALLLVAVCALYKPRGNFRLVKVATSILLFLMHILFFAESLYEKVFKIK